MGPGNVQEGEEAEASAGDRVIELFDTHCHLTDTAFRDDLGAVFRRARVAGVVGMVCIASDASDARAARELVEGRPDAWSTAGIHPHQAGGAREGDLRAIEALAESDAKVVAIGETGLDYHYDRSPRDVQRRLLAEHLELAHRLDLPAVVHARSADTDVIRALEGMPAGTRGVLHCFTGGEALFDAARERDWYVSFSGIASFRGFSSLNLLARLPGDRLLVETDSPYLAPVPRRGKRNEPAFVRHVAEAVAGHLGLSLADVARRTTENAHRFYALRS